MVVVLLNFLMKMRLYVVLSLFVCEHERREENLKFNFPKSWAL